MQSGLGVSNDPALVVAAGIAAEGALATCPRPALLLVLLTHTYPADDLPGALREVSARADGAIVAGGTVNGIACQGQRHDTLVNGRAVAVLAVGGDGVRAGVALAADPSADPGGVGRQLAAEAIQRLDGAHTDGGLIFTPGMSARPRLVDQRLLDGVRAVCPEVRLSGTGFSGGFTVEGMSLPGLAVLGERSERLGALLVLFSGVKGAFAISNGAKPTGKRALVEEAAEVVIPRLAGQPARAVALEMLAEGNAARAHFERSPLIASVEHGVSLALADARRPAFHWCHPTAAFTPDGGLIDLFEAPAGSELAAVRITAQDGLDACTEAGEHLAADAGTRDLDVAVAFSCGIRGFTLGERAAEEEAAFAASLGAGRRLVVIANGEIGCREGGPPTSTAWAFSAYGMTSGGS